MGTIYQKWFFASTALLFLWRAPLDAVGREALLWKLGEPDHSDHEFGPGPDARTNKPVVVHLGKGNEVRQWPKFQPGTGNGAFGGRPYAYTLVFDLPDSSPAGVFYLDLSLLFRQPRVPALDLEINGHRGRYHFDPEPMFELGGTEDQFNPIRSSQQRRIGLPASLFVRGENRLTFIAIDDPPALVRNRNVGGNGDSGFFYDSIALSHDSEARPDERVAAELLPTVFFPRTGHGVEAECQLSLRFPTSWPGGTARVSLGNFSTEVAVPKSAEFGEARYRVLIPANTAAGPARIELKASAGDARGAAQPQVCETRFTPARKWKIFYAPNEHLDVGYTDYRAKVAAVHARCMDELMKAFKAHPDYRFNLDGSWVLEQWLDSRVSRVTGQLTSQARAGRLGMNAFYSSVATEYPSLEENIRNLYLSKQLEKTYGVPFDFALVTDVPSVSWSVPSILAASGIRYFANGGNQDRGPMLVHGHWNVRSPFWWEGPDGARVLTWFSSHYHQLKALFGLPPTIESGQGGVARFLRAYEQAGYAPDAVLLYGTEVENLPTEYEDAAFIDQWNQRYAWPRLEPCRFADFFRYIEEHYAANLPVVRGTGGAYWADNFGIVASATARDRANQTRAVAAETIASLTAALDPHLRFARELDHEIWRDILGFAEHNFGTGRANGQPELDEVIGIVREKENYTVRAEENIDKLIRRGLSQLADQITTEGQNLIVFNPLSWTRSGLVTCQVDDGVTLTNLVTGQLVDCEILSEKDGVQTIRFEAGDVPAVGYKVFCLGRGPIRRGSAEGPILTTIVENRFYKIELDPSRAAIKSLYDKELGRELVDGASPYLLNEYLFVSGGGSETGRGRGAEDTQLLHPFPWLPKPDLTIHHAENGALLGVEKVPWGQRIRMTASAEHTARIQAEILLIDDTKSLQIDNEVQIDLLYAKQASYFAFPWACAAPVFHYDTPNGLVDPAADLLEGGCSDWFAVQHLVNVQGAGVSLDLGIGDAPLACLGDINRGRWQAHFTNNSATVFSYILNNYWSPKWSGKKSGTFRHHYVLGNSAHFDPAASARRGREARVPLELAVLKSSDKLPGRRGYLPAGQGSFVNLTPDNLVLTTLKVAEDGNGLVARVLETAGKESNGSLELPFLKVISAHQADAVEQSGPAMKIDDNKIRFNVKPYSFVTLRMASSSSRK